MLINNHIFIVNNIKTYYPREVEEIESLYSLFLKEKNNYFFTRDRKINFTVDEFNSLNLLLQVNGSLDIFQQCESLGLPKHIDYQELINDRIIDCGFLEGINYLYTVYKSKYKIVKIDLPETHLHPLVHIPLLKLISKQCKQLIIFTYSDHIYQRLMREKYNTDY